MYKGPAKQVDISREFNLISSLVTKSGLTGIVVVGPHLKRKKLYTLDLLLIHKNPTDNRSSMLDGIDLAGLLSQPDFIKRLSGGHVISGVTNQIPGAEYADFYFLAIPIINNSMLRLIAVAFNSGRAIAPEDQYFISAVMNLIGHVIELEDKVDDLKVSKNRYNRLFESAPEAIAMLDRNNKVLDVNPEFEQIFLYRKEDIIGKKLDELIAPAKLLSEARHLTKINWEGGKVAVETQRMRHDGKLIDVSVLGVPFIEGNGNLNIYGIYRDITERKHIEKQELRRLAFIEFISRLSSDLINMEVREIDQSINKALETAARVYSAERACLVRLADSGEFVEITHEWTIDPRFSHRERQPRINLNEIKEYFKKLLKGQMFCIHRCDIGNKEGTKELGFFFDLLDIETMVNIPLFVDNRFHDFIWFDTFSRPAHWDEQAINSFKLTGQILVNALERKNRELAYQEALHKAESSDKLKSAFLAGISHEVRTPMNHILGFIEVMDDPDLEQEEKDEYLAIMKSSGNHLLRLIDDVIELALIDSGQVMLNETPCDISRLLESLLVEFEGAKSDLNRESVKINLVIPAECRQMIVRTDEIRLRQILWNLLSNAVKFTPEGKIEFGISLKGFNHFEFYVSDTGIGIDAEDLPVIFERFRKIENGFSRKYGGAGLGLSISQGLASLFGNNIKVLSAKGSGSIFSFTIPYNLHVPDSEKYLKLNGAVHKFLWEERSILMVEDDPINMKFLTVLLLNTGANLLYASNGKEALEILEQTEVDLVLIDMHMPVMDGYEATRLIKKKYPWIPVIAQTAYAMKEDKANCLAAGCDDYLAKPIDKNKLCLKIERLIFPGKF
ncbi:MAG: response regulator [Lentimicrobium sp.]